MYGIHREKYRKQHSVSQQEISVLNACKLCHDVLILIVTKFLDSVEHPSINHCFNSHEHCV